MATCNAIAREKKAAADYDAFIEYNVMNINEIKKTKSAVEKLENGLNPPNVRGYLEYIVYEKNILRIILRAEERQGINLSNLKLSRIKRLIGIFEEGIKLFPTKFGFWDSYIRFCHLNAPDVYKELYGRCLEYHDDNEVIWCGALINAQDNGADSNHVREMFIKACIRIPNSEMIYVTYFGIVLKEISDAISKDPQNTTLQIKSLERLNALYESTKKNVGTLSSLLSLLTKCEDSEICKFTASLQKSLLIEINTNHALTEEYWDIIAKRELKGLSTCDLEKLPLHAIKRDPDEIEDIKPILLPSITSDDFSNPNDGNIWKARPLERRIELCCASYEAAVRLMNTKKMMEMYINTMIKLNSNMDELPELKRVSLVGAFKQGHSLSLLNEDHYCYLVKMFCENRSTKHLVSEIMPCATRQYNSVKLYELWISFYIRENDEAKVSETFRQAIKSLDGSSTFPLWKLIINYYISLGRNHAKTCQNFYKEACRYKYPEFETFRPKYLEWCISNLRMERTRTQYDTLCTYPPPSMKLHKKMIELEFNEIDINIERLRQCYKNTVKDFGKDNFTVWIDYITFEKGLGSVDHILEEAKTTLNPKAYENFLNSYRLLSSKI